MRHHGACAEVGVIDAQLGARLAQALRVQIKNRRDVTVGRQARLKMVIVVCLKRVPPAASQLEYQDVGALLMLDQAGLHVKEVDVVMPARANGKSRIFRSWGTVTYYMAQTLMLGFVKRRVGSAPQRDDMQQ